jgi:hypothetical protein
MTETVFYNFDRRGTQTFQIIKDSSRQVIRIRPFFRQGTRVEGVSYEYVFDPSALREHPDHGRFWTDHMCWAIENREDPRIPGFARALYPFCPPGAPDPEMRPLVPRMISVFVPFADSPVEEMMVMCYIGQGLQLVDTPARQADRRVIERELMPGFSVELPAVCLAGGKVEGRLHLRGFRVPKRLTAYLKASSGYLPKREIELYDGVGDFRFVARDLEPGDKARLDFGFQYFRMKTSCHLEVQE